MEARSTAVLHPSVAPDPYSPRPQPFSLFFGALSPLQHALMACQEREDSLAFLH